MDKNVVVCKNLSPELSPNLAKVSEGEIFTKPMEGDSCIPCLKKKSGEHSSQSQHCAISKLLVYDQQKGSWSPQK